MTPMFPACPEKAGAATFTCQLCGEEGKDVRTGADVLPWGATCADCLKLIEREGR